MILFILKYKISPDSYEELSAIAGIIFGAGALLGGILASIWSQKMKLYKMVILGLLLSGSFTCAAAFAASFWMLAILYFCVGFVLPLVNVGIGGWMPSIVDPKMMGRVQGWISPLSMLAQSIMLGFIAVSFPVFISIEVLYWIVGLALIIVGLFYGIQLPKYADTETTSEPAAEVNATV